MNGTAKLTLHQLRAVGNTGNPNRAPRLAKLAEFINDQCGDQVIATCEASETNTDRHYKGSRLRWPGKGRKGNALKVNARVELQLKGFLFGESAETFQKGQTIFEHDSSETYRHNGEAVRKTVLLVEQLILAILALMTAGCTNLYPEKSEHREREHEFMELHMKHIGK